jgi:hypothetical protein
MGEQPGVMTVNADAAQHTSFIVHRYLTALVAPEQAPFDPGVLDMAGNETVPDNTTRDSECPYCQDSSLFRACSDHTPAPAKDLTRTKPDTAVQDEPASPGGANDSSWRPLKALRSLLWG